MTVEVPAQMHTVSHTQETIQVVGGTNWDFGRTAQPTPIVPLPDPEPALVVGAAQAPAMTESRSLGTATVTVLFANHNAVIAKGRRIALANLPRTSSWVVVAHADQTEVEPLRFARARARAVVALLRSTGHTVSLIEASIAPPPDVGKVETVFENRSVAVYAVPQG